MTALGFVNSVITAGSTVNFQLGQEDVIQKAMLMVYANKLDGKEIQWYHPSAEIDVDIDMSSDAVVAKCNADLVAFIAVRRIHRFLAALRNNLRIITRGKPGIELG
jgi:hypothetical protein